MPNLTEACKAALFYQKMGLSIIPCRRDKKPLLPWQKYQTERATPEQIEKWWAKWPSANIGLVCGEVSRVDVIDCDSETGKATLEKFLPDNLSVPVSKTPNGWHYFFQHRPGLSNGVRILKDCDLRTSGGLAIVPPSKNGQGQSYVWLNGLKITDIKPPEMPDPLFNALMQGSGALAQARAYNRKNAFTRRYDVEQVNKSQYQSTSVNISFKRGYRDNTLFYLANHLLKSGMPVESIRKYLEFFGQHCKPPYPEKDIPSKIDSALKRLKNREKNLTQTIREWIESTSGNFSSTNVYEVSTKSTFPSPEEKRKISAVLCRFIKEGLIERVGNQNGLFRRIEGECEAMDFINCDSKIIPLSLPFGLHKMVEIMPGNIILVAGSPNAGKTAFLLNVIRYNMGKFKIYYFNSEMGSGELKKRLSKFDDIVLNDWNFKAYERGGQFQDVIKSGEGKINVIDFLEIHQNFYEISGHLGEIHNRLKGAVAIIGLQKNPGCDAGLGGYRTLEKPRLALAIDSGVLKIVKAKNWRTGENPNRKQIRFKLYQGWNLIPQGDWHKEI